MNQKSNLFERFLNRFFEKKVIVNCDRDPYLHRWFVIRTNFVALFIHRFVRSDEDRALHDHPWAFLVIPIWRGYVEHSDHPITESEFLAKFLIWSGSSHHYVVPYQGPPMPQYTDRIDVARRVYPIIGSRYRPATYRHRVELIDGRPSWSIFFRFRRVRDWGFWPKEGFVPWNKWWQDKCE